MKKVIIAITGVTLLAGGILLADGYKKYDEREYGEREYGEYEEYEEREIKRVAPVTNKLYKNECGSCHFAYQPGLLSGKSWEKVMKTLDDHFGTNATLEREDFQKISDYLKKNSKRAGYERNTPIAISQTPYFKKEHRKIPKRFITQKEVKSLSNCTACHTTAEKGYYGERGIMIPNYGRWDD